VAATKPKPRPYRVVNAPGGSYRVYPNGSRTFVAHGTGTDQGVGSVTGRGQGVPPREEVLSGTGTGQGVGSITARGQGVPTGGDIRDTARLPVDRQALDIPDVGKPYDGPPRPGSGTPSPNPPPTPGGGADPGPAPFQPDSIYFAAAAQNQFKATQSRNELDQQSAYAKTDFDEALRRMLEKQPRDVQAAREAANKAGLLYSGTLGRQEGDINTGYLRQQADMRQQFDRSEAAREVARRAIESGLSLDDAAQLAAAVDRQTVRDTAKADAGMLVPDQVAAPPGSKPPASKPGKSAGAASLSSRPATQPSRTVRVGGRTVTGRVGQGFGEITVGPARGGGRKKSGSNKKKSRRKGSGRTVTLTGSFAGAGGGTF
jgi:hypothetical protein